MDLVLPVCAIRPKIPLVYDHSCNHKQLMPTLSVPGTWYRTSHTNHLDDQALLPVSAPSLHVSTLMITATFDDAVKPAYAARMHRDVEFLTMREVPAGHWALWEAAGEVNALVKKWVEEVVFGEAKVLGQVGQVGTEKEKKRAKL